MTHSQPTTYVVTYHFHTHEPEHIAERFAVELSEEARHHLNDGESFNLTRVEASLTTDEAIREFIFSHSDDELMRFKAGWDDWKDEASEEAA